MTRSSDSKSSNLGAEATQAVQPDLVTQAVYGHLVFGPMARGKLGDLFSWAAILTFCFAAVVLVMTQDTLTTRLVNAFWPATILLCLHVSKIRSKPLLVQARMGWYLTKIVGGLLAFFGFLLPGFVGLLKDAPRAWYWSTLGAIWIPLPEFVPPLRSRQRFVTICRMLLSALLIFSKEARKHL